MMPHFPLNHFKDVEVPAGARAVVFAGHPRPHEAAQGKWPAPWFKRFYKSIRPVTWLNDHWR
jgi:hypothetical protein